MTDQQATVQPAASLSEIFAKMNMGELPAMSSNVRELISLTSSNWSNSADLAKIILKDYSLTNKVLQIVNSAYYSLGQPCNSISKAVTILGFNAIRDMAMVMSLFEDFIKSGADKGGVCKLLACSFLSGTLARDLVEAKQINVSSEEAFICSLFYNLGKNMVCIYLPDKYREIELNIDYGMSQNEACRTVLPDLTFHEIGAEVASFWNLSDKVVAAMVEEPKAPRHSHDTTGYLQNLASFANILVGAVCDGSSLGPVLRNYGGLLAVNAEDALAMLAHCVDVCDGVSDNIRYGLSMLRIRAKLRNLEVNFKNGFLNSASPEEQEMRKRLGLNDEDELAAEPAAVTELPASADKSVRDLVRDLSLMTRGSFDLDVFYGMLLNALYRGLGADRAILAMVSGPPVKPVAGWCSGLGEIDADGLKRFEQALCRQSPSAISNALKLGRDMVLPANRANAFPDDLHALVQDRTVYLFPICIDGKGIGLIYLDRKADRPLLDQDLTTVVSTLRDIAVKAIRKIKR